MARPIYLAIMAAFEAGRGVHLTAAEVQELGRDSAIVTRAAVTLDDDDDFVTQPGFTWTGAYNFALSSGSQSQTGEHLGRAALTVQATQKTLTDQGEPS